jgi:hypothetical protein
LNPQLAAMREQMAQQSALHKAYDEAMKGVYTSQMPTFAQWVASQGKAEGGVAHMAGGSIKELEDYIRQKKGDYGAKRVQRAADEIPDLERMYTEQGLREAFGGDNAKALMTMNPADFEKYALRLGSEEDESAYEGGMSRAQYLAKLAKIARSKGFEDVPFLEIGKRKSQYLPSIEGHEGRHRARALAGMNAPKTLVRLFPTPNMREDMPRRSSEEFIEAMKKELGENRFVTPEGRTLLPADLTAQQHKNLESRNLLAANRPSLPDIYAEGGSIKPIGYTKEQVTVSPNLDAMRYEMESVKRYTKKAK